MGGATPMVTRTELAKLVILTMLAFGSGCAQQGSDTTGERAGGVVLCGAGVTTNCYLKVDGNGNLTLPGQLQIAATLPSTAVTSFGNVVAWGDSLTAGVNGSGPNTPWADMLAAISGVNVATNAYSGWTSTMVAGLFASIPYQRKWFNVIWVGTNDIYNDIAAKNVPESTTISTIMANIAKMVAALPPDGRFIVMSPLSANAAANTWKGGPNYNYFTDLSAALTAAYPANYLDIREIIVNSYDPNCTTNPTYCKQDVVDHGHDTTPSSLVGAGVHLNVKGYRIVAQHVNSWMQSHGGQYVPTFASLNRAIYENATLWMRNPQTVASLNGWCGPNTVGYRRMVSDATSTTPGTLAAGGGTYTIAVQCVFNSAGYLFFLNID